MQQHYENHNQLNWLEIKLINKICIQPWKILIQMDKNLLGCMKLQQGNKKHLWLYICNTQSISCQRFWFFLFANPKQSRHYVGVSKCWRVFNYPHENMTHLGAANSHYQHIISDTGPTIRLNPSSSSGFARPRCVDLRFNWYHTSAKHICESI